MNATKKEKFEKTKTIKLFEAFSGVGAQYKALKNIEKSKNWKVESCGIIEWYIDAIIAYQAIHDFPNKIEKQSFMGDFSNLSWNSKNAAKSQKKLINSYVGFWLNRSKNLLHNLFNINTVQWTDIPQGIDIFTYSFPCQDLSNQGLGKGIDKKIKTRSGLLWQVERLLAEMKENMQDNLMPKYLLMENVLGIKNKKHVSNYKLWIEKLKKLNYSSHEYILNAKDFGLPQNRKRVFLLSIRNDFKNKINFQFQKITPDKKQIYLKDILQKDDQNKIFITNYNLGQFNCSGLVNNARLLNYSSFISETFVFDINGIGPTLTASGALSRIKLYENSKVRIMTPYETFLYMGFDIEDYLNILKTNLIKDSKQVFLMGNSIPVKVLEAIFKTLQF